MTANTPQLTDNFLKLAEYNLHETHWGKIIVEAEERGSFTKREKIGSSQWITCACGNIDADIPRNEDGQPLDLELSNLGADFHNKGVDKDNFEVAASTLVKIQLRATELIHGLS